MNKTQTGGVVLAEPVVSEARPDVLNRPATQPLEWSGVLAQKGYVLGADISAESERVVLADLSGNVIDRASANIEEGTSVAPDDVASRVSGMMRALLSKHQVKPRELLRAAVGFGGPVDSLRGEVRRHHDAPGWEGYPLARKIESALDVPTYLENDARLATLGEVWFGAGRETAECDMVYVHWSTGVGGGIATDGKLLRGSSTIAGEFGHTVVVAGESALPCRCGGKGHLEAYIRGTALLARARDMLGEANAPADITSLFALAGANPGIQGLLDEAVALMGITIANLITQVNPNLVVIGGSVARHADSLIPKIADIALQLAMPVSTAGVTIVPTALGNEATLMGAVALALDSLR